MAHGRDPSMGSPEVDQDQQAFGLIAKGSRAQEGPHPWRGFGLEWLLLTNLCWEAEVGQSWGEKGAVTWHLRTGSGLCFELEAM